jgi:hypothetical protein
MIDPAGNGSVEVIDLAHRVRLLERDTAAGDAKATARHEDVMRVLRGLSNEVAHLAGAVSALAGVRPTKRKAKA